MAAVEAWGCARWRLLPAVRGPGGLAARELHHPPTPGRGGYGPAPLPASMAGRRNFGSTTSWKLRSFQFPWLKDLYVFNPRFICFILSRLPVLAALYLAALRSAPPRPPPATPLAPPAASCPAPPLTTRRRPSPASQSHLAAFSAVHRSPPPTGRDLVGGRGWEGAALASDSRSSRGPICVSATSREAWRGVLRSRRAGSSKGIGGWRRRDRGRGWSGRVPARSRPGMERAVGELAAEYGRGDTNSLLPAPHHVPSFLLSDRTESVLQRDPATRGELPQVTLPEKLARFLQKCAEGVPERAPV
ncbi:uncharacterized protein [Triticum aestivum]|uniref:uncharacterized protein n=1 Tax=Triticum aestivum TaxID=4565 RepID=UPI001D03470E|nr:uncharacterized protein LOC123170720 [Triticum aestivum]